MEPVLQNIHGAPGDGPVGPLTAVTQDQHGFGITGCHAQYPGEPAPKYRAWAPQRHGGGDPDDIPGADGGSQSGGQGAKAGYAASVPTETVSDPLEGPSLDAPESQGKI